MRAFALAVALLAWGVCQAAAPSPAAGEAAQAGQFRDWSKGCEKAAGEAQERCFIFQTVTLNDTSQAIIKAVIGHLTDDPKETVLILTAPLGVYLPAGVELDVGKYMRKEKHDYLTCDNKGCRAVIEMSGARLKAFKQAPRVKITIRDGQHRAIEIPLSLRGLTAGLDAI
jgi:invasion protein IalB